MSNEPKFKVGDMVNYHDLPATIKEVSKVASGFHYIVVFPHPIDGTYWHGTPEDPLVRMQKKAS